ncbi:histidine kinase [Kribbella sp. CA-245084]|uniref:sensor histidine kinase n=1 Tax=Kribbella sp. CA-245084 TaxID=3239940 RepID=UPI003D91424E
MTTTAASRRGLVGLLAGFVVAEVAVAVGYLLAIGWGWHEMVDSFMVTNGLMALTFGLCGAVIAWHRPSNPIGWLFLADGIGHATTPLAGALAEFIGAQGGSLSAQRVFVTISSAAWPWSIGLFLPLALLLFPTGHLLSPRWRWAAIGIIATAPLFVLEMVGSGDPIAPDLPRGYLAIPSYDDLQPVWTLTELRNLLAILLAIVCLAVRYRRADETGRRQLLWLLLASVIAILFVTPWAFVTGTPILVLLAIPLIPISVAVAIVRYQLLDIRLVISRALTWGLLSLVAIGIYAVLVALLDSLIASQVGRSAAVTVFVALIIAPVLPRLQQLVDRALYGDRHDPARVASRVGEQLSAGLPGVVAAIRSALRLPYAALTVDGEVIAVDGTLGAVVPLELSYGGEVVGSLDIGVRSGESGLSSADRSVLALVAVPLAVAVHATRLSAELQSSREKLISAREEERRRLRRDLHDGLGPTLTGIAFSADAVANLITPAPPPSPPPNGTQRSADPPAPPPPNGTQVSTADTPPPPSPNGTQGSTADAPPPPSPNGTQASTADAPPPPSPNGTRGSTADAHPSPPPNGTQASTADAPPPPSPNGTRGSAADAHPPPPPNDTPGSTADAPPPPSPNGTRGSADAPPPSPDTSRAVELLTRLRADTRTAIGDIRRLVDDLRPPALDELGLVGALRQRADQLSFRADGATIHVAVSANGLPTLPAALEVAAYRIATEALTNVVRHSRATSAVLALRCGSDLEIEVTDDGPPNGAWRPGVGLQAMRERAAELGGTFNAGPTPTGGLVRASFPLATTAATTEATTPARTTAAPTVPPTATTTATTTAPLEPR